MIKLIIKVTVIALLSSVTIKNAHEYYFQSFFSGLIILKSIY